MERRRIGTKKPEGSLTDYWHLGEYHLRIEMKKLYEELTEPNLGYALGYKRQLEIKNRDAKTIYRRLHELRFCLKTLDKDAKKATKTDIEALVLAINKAKRHDGKDMADVTKGKTRRILKTFYKWLMGNDELVGWVSADEGRKKRKLPEEMLTEDDVKALIEACINQRDKAVVALLWDAGLRAGELLSLKMKDVVLNGQVSYLMVSYKTKTGARRVPLILSVPYIANYLNELRRHAKPDDPLFTTYDQWHKHLTNNPYDYKDMRKLLDNLNRWAKLKKRLYAHLFRHSRATFYASKGMSEQQMKMFFGWTGGSSMPATYVHLSGAQIDDAVLKANGIERAGEPDKPKLITKMCIKCGKANEATAKYCSCGFPLDDFASLPSPSEYATLKEQVAEMRGAWLMMLEGLDAATKQKIADALKQKA